MARSYHHLRPRLIAAELTAGASLQRLAKQLGVPGGGKGSRKELEERLATFNRYDEFRSLSVLVSEVVLCGCSC